MATRASIKVEGIDFAKLYKHWDGYPEATLGWLESFNKDFETNRRNNPSYKFAQLVRSSSRLAEEFNLDKSIYTGWGIESFNQEMSIDFEYTLKADGSVIVLKRGD